MATVPRHRTTRTIDYPTGDGKPMAESDIHRNDMVDLIQSLEDHFAAEPLVYVSGNLLMFYEAGNRRKHLAPDVFVVRGVAKRARDNYLIWEERKAPDMVVEITSKSTRHKDTKRKWALYQDVLRVQEYFLFDPTRDYLNPPLQGFRLVAGRYISIKPISGRQPSEVLGLHLEADGFELRLYDPITQSRLPTRIERAERAQRVAERLREELEALRRRADRK
jgi:Uma2 family endonuclease